MAISTGLMLLALMLLLALLLKPIAEKYNIPFAGLLVVTGFVGSEILVYFGVDTGVRYDSFHDLILFVSNLCRPLYLFLSSYYSLYLLLYS